VAEEQLDGDVGAVGVAERDHARRVAPVVRAGLAHPARELLAARAQIVEVEVAHPAAREEARCDAVFEHLAARAEQRRLGSELAAEVDQLVLVATRAVQQQQRRGAAARLVAVDERLDGAHWESGRHARMSGIGVRTGSMRSRRCSNGANIAVELHFRHGGTLRGAALLRPMLPYRPDEPLSLVGTGVLIAAGDADPYSSPQQIEELAELLAAGGAEVQVSRQPVGHELTQADLDALAGWIRPHVAAA
jgi:hypothetical protein